MGFVSAIKEAFYALENPENAHWMRWYMRDQYPFIGIKKPERTTVFKEIYKAYGRSEDWFEVCSELFAEKTYLEEITPIKIWLWIKNN